LSGCTSLVTDLRKEGFALTHGSFERIPAGREFSREYELKIKVHVVDSRVKFKHQPYRGAAMGVIGYASTGEPPEIWVIGKQLPDGTIIINQHVLGHELNHVLSWQGGEVVNPDNLDQMGY
jgi:hypothetical protein